MKDYGLGAAESSLQDILDPATGLPGEALFRDCLVRETERASRYGEDLSVLLIQGEYAESLPAHDREILSIAWGQALPGLLRRMDQAFGLGSLSMGVVLPHCPEAGLRQRGDALIAHFANIRSLALADQHDPRVFPRAGAAVYERGESVSSLVAQAEAGLESARRHHSSQVILMRHPLPDDTS